MKVILSHQFRWWPSNRQDQRANVRVLQLFTGKVPPLLLQKLRYRVFTTCLLKVLPSAFLSLQPELSYTFVSLKDAGREKHFTHRTTLVVLLVHIYSNNSRHRTITSTSDLVKIITDVYGKCAPRFLKLCNGISMKKLIYYKHFTNSEDFLLYYKYLTVIKIQDLCKIMNENWRSLLPITKNINLHR